MATQTESGRGGLVDDQVTLGRLVVPVAIVVIWKLLSMLIGADLLPGPVRTLEVIQAGVESGWVVSNLINTLVTLAIGFAIASIAGFVVGVVLGTRNTAFDFFEPFVLNTYAIPKIVLFPVFLLIFKLGMDQKVAFGAFHGFFPMLIITMGAVRELPQIYVDVGRSLRLSRAQTARHIVLPFILVHLTVALRFAFSLTFLGVILSELFAARSGIGLQLRHAMSVFNTDRIMAIVTVLMVIAFVGNLAFYAAQVWLERRWNLSAEATV